MSLSWTQPTCERCWIIQNAEWEDNDRLVGVNRPVMVMEAELEICSYCGFPTIVGIYTRADPATVRYPKEKDD